MYSNDCPRLPMMFHDCSMIEGLRIVRSSPWVVHDVAMRFNDFEWLFQWFFHVWAIFSLWFLITPVDKMDRTLISVVLRKNPVTMTWSFPPKKHSFKGPGDVGKGQDSLTGPNMCAGKGLCGLPWSPLVSSGLPWSPAVSRGFPSLLFKPKFKIRGSGQMLIFELCYP